MAETLAAQDSPVLVADPEIPREETTVDKDAAEFGLHFKQGGWRLGLLVARNVEKKQGKRTDLATSGEVTESKVSAAEFAKRAGVSESTVKYYFDAWQIAAIKGRCTPAEDLSPGEDDVSSEFDEIETDDSTTNLDMRKEWQGYMAQARKSPKSKSSENESESTTPQRLTVEDLPEDNAGEDEDNIENDDVAVHFNFGTLHEQVLEIRDAVEANAERLNSLDFTDNSDQDKVVEVLESIRKSASAVIEACDGMSDMLNETEKDDTPNE